MKALSWIILVALVLLAIFAAANWALLTAPAPLNLIVATVDGPPGMVLLCAIVLFVVLYTVYALSVRTTALIETRRQMKALESQRELAETAEASRFTALGSRLDEEFARLRALVDETRTQSLGRAEALEAALAHKLDETANALFANIGEVDDKLDRLSGAPAART
jgi:uncharacterized integral membrane protein